MKFEITGRDESGKPTHVPAAPASDADSMQGSQPKESRDDTR